MCFKYILFFNIVFSLSINFAYGQLQKGAGIKKDTTSKIFTLKKKDTNKTDSSMVALLKQYPLYFDRILKNQKPWNVQFIYTQIDRGANGIPALKNFYFNVDSFQYFYPASAVKFPVCLLALQRLNELQQQGVTMQTPMITEAAQPGQTAVYNDPTTFDGKPNIANYIKKILMVSDNDAYNRLYEFLGSKYINQQLHQKGYTNVQILHRLETTLTPTQNRQTNPINFLNENGKIIYSQPPQEDATKYTIRHDSLGKGYLMGDSIVHSAMDFSNKNRIGLEEFNNLLISLIFPIKVTAAQRFNITATDRNFLLKYMSQLPTESAHPPYAGDTAYWPAYGKFLLYGSEAGKLPDNIRIFNKIGEAYGQLTDVAYIVDFKNNIEFFLSATIYCNSDGILNDDQYDYETIGFPFLKHLGEVIYQQELKRTKKIAPDLSEFLYNYGAD